MNQLQRQSERSPEQQNSIIWERGPVKIIHHAEDHFEIHLNGIRTRTKAKPDFTALDGRFKSVAFDPWMTRYLEALLVAYKTGQHRAVMAPSGTGKSWGPRIFAALIGSPIEEAALHASATDADFYGRFAPDTTGASEYAYLKGPVLRALENGSIVVLQEGLKLSLTVRSKLLDLLEAPNTPGVLEKVIELPTGEKIPVKEGFFLLWNGRPPESTGFGEEPLSDEEQRRTPILHLGTLSSAEEKLRRSTPDDREELRLRYADQISTSSASWAFRLLERPSDTLPRGLSIVLGDVIDAVQMLIIKLRDGHNAQKFQPLSFINVDQRIIEMMHMIEIPQDPTKKIDVILSAFQFFLQTYYAHAFDPDKKVPGGNQKVGEYLRAVIATAVCKEEVRDALEKVLGIEAKLELDGHKNVIITAQGSYTRPREGIHTITLRNTGHKAITLSSIQLPHSVALRVKNSLGQDQVVVPGRTLTYPYSIISIKPGENFPIHLLYSPGPAPLHEINQMVSIQTSFGTVQIPVKLCFQPSEEEPPDSKVNFHRIQIQKCDKSVIIAMGKRGYFREQFHFVHESPYAAKFSLEIDGLPQSDQQKVQTSSHFDIDFFIPEKAIPGSVIDIPTTLIVSPLGEMRGPVQRFPFLHRFEVPKIHDFTLLPSPDRATDHGSSEGGNTGEETPGPVGNSLMRSIQEIDQLPEGSTISYDELSSWLQYHDLEQYLDQPLLQSVVLAKQFYTEFYGSEYLFPTVPVYRVKNMGILKEALQKRAVNAAMVMAYPKTEMPPNTIVNSHFHKLFLDPLLGQYSGSSAKIAATAVSSDHPILHETDAKSFQAVQGAVVENKRKKSPEKVTSTAPEIFFYGPLEPGKKGSQRYVLKKNGTCFADEVQPNFETILLKGVQILSLAQAMILARYLKVYLPNNTSYRWREGLLVSAFAEDKVSWPEGKMTQNPQSILLKSDPSDQILFLEAQIIGNSSSGDELGFMCAY